MAGMLPGVELARRRRANHHSFETNNPRFSIKRSTSTNSSRDSSSTTHHHLLRFEPSSTKDMDETTLQARKRLEQKLRGFVGVSSVTVKNIIKPSNRLQKSHGNSQGIKETGLESSPSTQRKKRNS